MVFLSSWLAALDSASSLCSSSLSFCQASSIFVFRTLSLDLPEFIIFSSSSCWYNVNLAYMNQIKSAYIMINQTCLIDSRLQLSYLQLPMCPVCRLVWRHLDVVHPWFRQLVLQGRDPFLQLLYLFLVSLLQLCQHWHFYMKHCFGVHCLFSAFWEVEDLDINTYIVTLKFN